MNDPVLIAIVSALGLILSGVLVELARARRAAGAVADAVVTPPGVQSMGDLVTSTSADVKDLSKQLGQLGTRLAVVERLLDDHLSAGARGRGR